MVEVASGYDVEFEYDSNGNQLGMGFRTGRLRKTIYLSIALL